MAAVEELTNCLPGTEAKLITKSQVLALMPNRIPTAETKAWICPTDYCFNVMPQLYRNPIVVRNIIFLKAATVLLLICLAHQ